MPRLCSSLLLSLVIASSVEALTLTFDDLTTNACCDPVPSGYGGLDWQDFRVALGTAAGPGYTNARVSGDYVAYNDRGLQASATGGVFDFTSVYLTAAWNNGLRVQVQGVRSGSLVYDTTVTVNTSGPTLFDFDFLAIDALFFSSFGGINAGLGGSGFQFAMDNMTIEAVPEPGTGLLVLAGLIGLAGGRRERH